MSDWRAIDGTLGPTQAIDATSTTQNHPLGMRICCRDMDSTTDYGYAEFVYLKGVASTAAGLAVTYDAGVYTTTLSAANAVGNVAIAMSANVANQYGWYQVTGKAIVKVLASFAADAVPYLTATAGSLDDAVVAGDLVQNAYSISAIDTPTTGYAFIAINDPIVVNA